VPKPNARATVSCALPQKFVDEKNEPSQVGARPAIADDHGLLAEKKRTPLPAHRIACMMVRLCAW
jgi:hypothetical protein